MLAIGDVEGAQNASKQELTAVASLYGATPLIGKEASADKVRTQADKVDILHIASPTTFKAAETPKMYSRLIVKAMLAAKPAPR